MTARLFVDEAGNTLTDERTGLMWQLEDDGEKRTLEQGRSYCAALSIAGHTDWRLPEIQEIRSIGDVWRFVFVDPKHDEPYWSSSLVRNPVADAAESMKHAALVFFSHNEENQYWPHYKYYTRAVRRAASYVEVDSFRSEHSPDNVSILRGALEAAERAMRQAEPQYHWGDGKSVLGYGSVVIRSNQPLYATALREFAIGSELKTVRDLGVNRGGVFTMCIESHTYREEGQDFLNFIFQGPQQLEMIGIAGALAFSRELKASGVPCWACHVFD